jgi:hypothetical protein
LPVFLFVIVFGCWDYKEGFALYCYDGKLEIDNWKGARYSVDFNTGQASFMFSGNNFFIINSVFWTVIRISMCIYIISVKKNFFVIF